jgi:zinc transport system substrate-binding protein
MPALRLIAALIVVVALAGCGGSSGGSNDDSRNVVASFYPLEYAAQEVGGPDLKVTNLTPPGAEPHDVELTARDVSRIRNADVLLYLGAGFQPAVADAAKEAKGTVVDLLDGIQLHDAQDGETVADPHVWLDPVLYARIVRGVARALGEPGGANSLVRRLELLDRDYRQGLANCQRREIVTSHAAFGYLAARYGLEQVPIAGVSPEAEPTPRELEAAAERVRESGATTVFFETLVSPRLAKTVARETGATTAVLDPLEGLTEDEVARGDDYFTVMRRNLAAVQTALGCR